MIHPPHWYVLGAGAIGSLIAYRLRQAGGPYTLLQRQPGATKRTIIDGDRRSELDVLSSDTLSPASIKYLLLATKAGQLAQALESARALLARDAVIITIANGLGFEPALKALCPDLPLYRAVSTAAAHRSTAAEVTLAAVGRTRIGCVDAPSAQPDWFDHSLGHLEGWHWEPAIETAIGEKFSLNCVINPLTAVMRCRNGELLKGAGAGPELTALCAESEPVLRELGLWRSSRSLLEAAVGVCQSTAENRSSMLQDILAGRPTEIDFLNGELLRRAGALRVSLPENQALLASLE